MKSSTGFLSWGFKDRPSVVHPSVGARSPVSPPAPFVRQQPCCRLLRSCRFNDFSGAHLPFVWPMACHQPCRPWGSCRFTATSSRWWLLPDTRQPFEVFPSSPAAPPSRILQAGWIPLHRLCIPSRRWSALSASPRRESMSPSLRTAARSPLSATSGYCAIDESVVSAASSDRAPVTPMGFASAWLEKSSDLQLRTPKRARCIDREGEAFRARVHPTSRSAATHILQYSPGAKTPCLDPHYGCAPQQAPWHRSAPTPRGRRVARIRIGGPLRHPALPKDRSAMVGFLAALFATTPPREACCCVQRSGFVLLSSSRLSVHLPREMRLTPCARRHPTPEIQRCALPALPASGPPWSEARIIPREECRMPRIARP